MAGPEKMDTGKGKGKSRGDGGGSVARPAGETTPRQNQDGSRLSFSSGRGGIMAFRTAQLARLCSEPVKAPRPKTVCIFAIVVVVLALFRSLLLPAPGSHPPAMRAVTAEQEDELVRLVLAEELEGFAKIIQAEKRSFEDLLARRAGALDEIKVFDKKLKASGLEMRQLEGLGRTVYEDNSGDAGLTTEVARAQDGLRDLHRSVTDALGGFKHQLERQAEAMRTVRSEVSKVEEQAKDARKRVAAKAHEILKSKLEAILGELADSRGLVAARVGNISTDVTTDAKLKSLLKSAAQPSERTGAKEDDERDVTELVRSVSGAVVNRALERMLGGSGDGCVSEEYLMEETEIAIERLAADGTGLRDYANVAVGGRVLTANGMVSSTYTPVSWWGPSRYWHGAGVENGVGPVDSVISEDSSLGACWAMSGSQGYVTIQLPRDITVEGVSIEHASRMVTPESSSTPAEFQVYGLRNKADTFPIKLGNGMYDVKGRPIQTFPIAPLGRRFGIIQLRILSNWGNPDFTCIYRVRVHGKDITG